MWFRSAFRSRFLVFVASCLAFVVVGACWLIGQRLSPRPGGSPALAHLVLDASPRDLGVVLPGETLPLQYEIRNAGIKELKVSDLHTSCGCAPASLDQNPIPPGRSAVISVSFHAPPVAGPVTHLLSFHTNDPAHQDVELAFRALAKRPVEVVPPHVYAGVLIPGQEVAHEVELYSTDAVPFEVRSISASASWLHVKALPEQASCRHRFRVSIKGQLPAGAFSEAIRFVTSCSKQQEIIVPVAGELATGLRTSPASLLLQSALPGSTAEGRLTITATDDAPPVQTVTVKGADWQLLTWKTERVSSSAWRLFFRVRVPATAGYKRSSLVLRGAAPDDAQVVPLSCLVRRTEPTKQ